MTDGSTLVAAVRSGDADRMWREIDGVVADLRSGRPRRDAIRELAEGLVAPPNEAIRFAEAIEFIGRHGPIDDALEPLLAAADSSAPEVSAWAWRALGSLVSSTEADDGYELVRSRLGRVDPARALPVLRSAARRGFDLSGGAADALYALVDHGKGDERPAAYAAIADASAAGSNLGDLPVRLSALVGEKRTVPTALAETLTAATLSEGDPDRVEALLHHPSPQVQAAARRAALDLAEQLVQQGRGTGDAAKVKRGLALRRLAKSG
jgi:hypothetical protein